MKQELIESLLELLESEYKIYEEILSLAKRKTDIVVQGKVSELDHIVKLEQALVLQISKIDKKRDELFQNSNSGDKINNKNWNVTELKKIASEEQSGKLQNYQDSMVNILSELNNVNQLNSKLITNSLEFIEFSLNLISTADITSNNYGNKGDTLNKEKKNLFDIRL